MSTASTANPLPLVRRKDPHPLRTFANGKTQLQASRASRYSGGNSIYVKNQLFPCTLWQKVKNAGLLNGLPHGGHQNSRSALDTTRVFGVTSMDLSFSGPYPLTTEPSSSIFQPSLCHHSVTEHTVRKGFIPSLPFSIHLSSPAW